MADIVDEANDLAQREVETAIRMAAKPLPAGEPGDCDLCGEWFGRLVGGACVPCRNRYKLP